MRIELRDWQIEDIDSYTYWNKSGHDWLKLDEPSSLKTFIFHNKLKIHAAIFILAKFNNIISDRI